MRPLTDSIPKPLVPVLGRPLIHHVVERLVRVGVTELVINLGYRGTQIRDALGNGRGMGARIRYSEEGDPPLETGGGVFQALPLLGDAPFLLVNADVFSDVDLASLRQIAARLPESDLGHLVLVEKPEYRSVGDFRLARGRVFNDGENLKTFSGLSVLRGRLFEACQPGRFGLAPLLRTAADRGLLGGELHAGMWSDVGTPQRLVALEDSLRGRP